MDISLHDITKDNWEYVVSLTTNEDKRPSVLEKYLNGNAYSMLEALYNPELTMKVIVLSEGEKLKGVGFTLYGPLDNDGETVYMIYRFMIDVRFQGQVNLSGSGIQLGLGENGADSVVKQLFGDVFRIVTVKQTNVFQRFNTQQILCLCQQSTGFVVQSLFLFNKNTINHGETPPYFPACSAR